MTEPDVVSSLPPVVAVMVVHEMGDWLTESIRGLATQDYPSLQTLVLVTGNEEDEGARQVLDIVATELPAAVVRFLGGNPGYGAACNSVLKLVQGDSGFFCFMHDDVALNPDAISLLVDELYRSNAGAVGPKLVYWDQPTMIQSVGMAVDRFGVALAIAEDGELDQEQHDAVQDVFALSGACVLVRADLFRTISGFNPDLAVTGADVDLCWRIHATAGRVVIVPSAIGRHRENATRAMDEVVREDSFLDAEIARVRTVASLTSIAQLPFTLMQLWLLTIARIPVLLATGRARQTLVEMRAVWALPFALGDIRSRRAALAEHRAVDGDEVRALQLAGSAYVTAFFRRRAQTAGLAQAQAADTEREATPRSAYVLWSVLAGLFLLGSRSILTNGAVAVGQMAPITASTRELIASYSSGWWSAGFGQVSALPTGIAVLAAGSIATLGRIGLFHTLSIAVLPLVGWCGMWRFASVLGTRSGRIASVACYAAVPLPYAAISSGRWGALLVYAALPWMIHLSRMLVGHADLDDRRDSEPMVNVVASRWRKWFASLTLLTAIVFAFEPAIVVVVPIVAVVFAVVSAVQGIAVKWSVRWLVVLAGTTVAGIVMNLPWAGTYIRSGWWEALTGAPVEGGRNIGLFGLAQFNIGSFTLSTVTLLLYVVVVGAILLVRGVRAGWVMRGASLAVVGLGLAILDDSSLSPIHLPEPAILLVLVAFGMAVCAGAMGTALVVDLRRARFGWRQPLSGLVALAFVIGLAPMALNSIDGRWNQPSLSLPQLLTQLPDTHSGGEYRTLFIGDSRVLPAAPLNFGWGISYSIVNGSAPTLEEMWETPPTRVRDNAVAAMYGIVRGQTSRAGRLLAPLSVRFIVVPIIDGGQSTRSNPIKAPNGLVDSLSRQLDLRRLYASPDLVIFENSSWVPVRSVLTAVGAESSKLAGASSMIASDISGATPLPTASRPETTVSAVVEAGTLHLSVPYTTKWKVKLDGQQVMARPAFGLTDAFDLPTKGQVSLSFATSGLQTMAVLFQFMVWCVVAFIALSRRRRRVSSRTAATMVDNGPVIVLVEGEAS